MILMQIQIPKVKWVNGAKVVNYEIDEVIGKDVYDAWEKAVAAGHDVSKQVRWREYAV